MRAENRKIAGLAPDFPFNRLTATQTASFTFDANGNANSKAEGTKRWSYLWDYENRPTKAWDRKNTVRYVFDALGRRVMTYAGAKGQTKFTYEGNDVLLDDSDGTLSKYINGSGIDNKLRSQTGSNTAYFLGDHLGSTNGLTDSAGSLTSSNRYDSFGNPTNTAFPTRYQFTGREFDAITGLQFSRARWYDPTIGRFITEDPIGFAAGNVNSYNYVSNSPTNAVDPSGLYEIDVHYYLTYYLAMRTGCFTQGQSFAIAHGNQSTDEIAQYSPDLGRQYQNSTYHALNSSAYPGQASPFSVNPKDYIGFGRSLHYHQDTFSHAGYSNDYYGHLTAGHYWDKTNSDPARAVRMAADTWDAMAGFAKASGCACKPQWTTSMSDTVVSFVLAPGSDTPRRNAIDSTGEAANFFIVNPSTFLNNKIRILGVGPR